MSDFEIEKDVAPPRGRPGGTKYPWSDMEPGDSFAVPLNGKSPSQIGSQVGNAGRGWCERNRPDCTVIGRTKDGEYRVWLVEKE